MTKPMPLTLEVRGIIAGGQISGTVSARGIGSMPFTGTRVAWRECASTANRSRARRRLLLLNMGTMGQPGHLATNDRELLSREPCVRDRRSYPSDDRFWS
jgi:hypothetical protein